jgi:hypothetical protein
MERAHLLSGVVMCFPVPLYYLRFLLIFNNCAGSIWVTGRQQMF